MEEKLIRNISLLCSFLGLIALLIISRNFQLEQTLIEKITYEDTGKVVKICGEVVSKHSSKTGHQFLKLSDNTGVIDVVIFNTTAKKFNFDFDNACVTGTVDEYENKLEVIVKDVKVN